MSIYTEGNEIIVEESLVTIYFDKEEVEELIVDHYSYEYSDHIQRMVAPEGAYFATDFTFYNDIERHDVLHDLMYYHKLEPTRIKLISEK